VQVEVATLSAGNTSALCRLACCCLTPTRHPRRRRHRGGDREPYGRSARPGEP